MRSLVYASCLVGALAATTSAALAFDAEETAALRDAFKKGLEGGTVDDDALNALISNAADGGIVPLDFFEGTLEPLDGPVTLRVPKERRFTCKTDVEISPQLPGQGSPLDSEERVHIQDLGDGRRRVIFETVDAEATIGVKLVSDGTSSNLEEFSVEESSYAQRFVMRADGSMHDDVSGETLKAESADVKVITRMVDLVAVSNPFWFAPDAKLRAGEGYYEDKLVDGLVETMGAIIGLSNNDQVEVDLQFFRYLLTGMTTIDDRPQLVFQGAMRAEIDSSRLGEDLPIEASFVQMFDAETALQSLYITRLTVKPGGTTMTLTQTQTCKDG